MPNNGIEYEPDPSHRKKHGGGSSEAQILVDVDGNLVSKCSNEIDPTLAGRLLREGIPWSSESSRSPLPEAVFNLHRGIPYRAHRRGKTRFYHGFPDVRRRMPGGIWKQLADLAIEQGVQQEFERWMTATENLG